MERNDRLGRVQKNLYGEFVALLACSIKMTSDPTRDISALQYRFSDYVARRGLRSTSQRRLVTETFFRSDGHLSIEDLLTEVRKEDPKVGYATIYRTLKLLRESGLANERQFGDGVSRYEVAQEDEHHDHLICTSCGLIVEFEEPTIEALQTRVAEEHGFVLNRHRLELFGLCTECQKNPPPDTTLGRPNRHETHKW